jgi:hypothetical protein
MGRWDIRLFQENGGASYLKVAAVRLSALPDSDGDIEAQFIAHLTSVDNKQIIYEALQRSSLALSDSNASRLSFIVGNPFYLNFGPQQAFQTISDQEQRIQFKDTDPHFQKATQLAFSTQLAERSAIASLVNLPKRESGDIVAVADDPIEVLRQQLNVVSGTVETPRGLITALPYTVFSGNAAGTGIIWGGSTWGGSTGQNGIGPEMSVPLTTIARILLAYPGLMVRVEGNIDSGAFDGSDQILSQRYSDAVRNYLISQGLPAASIWSVGKGALDPIAGNETVAGRALNRRVNLVISDPSIGLQ